MFLIPSVHLLKNKSHPHSALILRDPGNIPSGLTMTPKTHVAITYLRAKLKPKYIARSKRNMEDCVHMRFLNS